MRIKTSPRFGNIFWPILDVSWLHQPPDASGPQADGHTLIRSIRSGQPL